MTHKRLAATEDPHGHGRPRPRHILQPGRPDPLRQVRAEWAGLLERLDFAFQPIVNIHTGYCFGYEALLRNISKFPSIGHFFDACYAEGVLSAIEDILQEKALAKFARLPHHPRCKLFLNLDNRLLSGGGTGEGLPWLLDEHGLSPGSVCFEISERHALEHPARAVAQLQALKRQGFRLAVDDFGTGFSGLQMLYQAEPDLIKIDRFFITDIANDARKKLFLTQIVHIAHLLGAVVVAEGVETEQEYFVCKTIGCDLVQGWLVQRPTLEVGDLALHYPAIQALAERERRANSGDQRLIRERIEAIAPLPAEAEMETVFDRFRDGGLMLVPVIDGNGEPLGIVREHDMKALVYSRYGKELMSNRAIGRRLQQFLVKCPMVDVNTPAHSILQTFSAADSSVEGIIVTQDMKYAGFLSMRSLLQVINDKNLQAARDQNPLTRLPGNNLILQHLSNILPRDGADHLVAYLDFDNFKPFNDKYGFRLGDRAILLFAEIMAKRLQGEGVFLGHIGGDDFFVAIRGGGFDDNEARIRGVIEQFGLEVLSFYDESTRRAGYLEAQDRHGETRRFPLLGVSAAMLHLPASRQAYTTEEIGWLTAELKKSAKASETRTCSAGLLRR